MGCELMWKIYTSDWQKWPSEIRMALRALIPAEESEDSGMLHNIHRIENEGIGHKTFMLVDEHGTIAGWSMATWDGEYNEYDIMLYVRRSERRMGYGRKLFNRAKGWVNRQGKPFFFFPDPVNKAFFMKVAPEKF